MQQLFLDVTKKRNLLQNRIVGRVGDRNLLTVELVLTDDGAAYSVGSKTISFKGMNGAGEYVVGTAKTQQGEAVQYTFRGEDFSRAGSYERAYFEITDSSGTITTEDFQLEVLDAADISAEEAAEYVNAYNKLIAELNAEFAVFLAEKQKDYSTMDAQLRKQFADFLAQKKTEYAELDALNKKLSADTLSLKEQMEHIQENVDGMDFFNKTEASVNIMEVISGHKQVEVPMQSDFTGKVAGSLTECPHVLEADVQSLGARNLLLDTNTSKRPPHLANYGAGRANVDLAIDAEGAVHVTTTTATDPHFRPVNGVKDVFQASVDYILSFKYKTGPNNWMRIRLIGTNNSGSNIITYQGEGVGFVKFKGSTTNSAVYTSFDIISNESGSITTVGDTLTLKDLSVTESSSPVPYYPAPEDLGVVSGQPNLLNGTSNEWKTANIQFTNIEFKIADKGIKAGDKLALRGKFKNVVNATGAQVNMYFRDSTGTQLSTFGSGNLVTNEGYSNLELTVPENTDVCVVRSCRIEGFVTGATTDYCETKLIKGPLSAMDDYSPSQADSGMTIINDGRAELYQAGYDAVKVAGDGKTVKLTQLLVGKFAELETRPFNILEQVEREMPWILENCTTVADKVQKLRNLAKTIVFTACAKGSGYASNGAVTTTINTQLKHVNNSWMATGQVSSSSGIVKCSSSSTGKGGYIRDDGTLITKVRTNGTSAGPDAPATLEVDHISLTVTFEVNGKDYLLQMFVPRAEFNALYDRVAALESK